jgi:hypothetical protein
MRMEVIILASAPTVPATIPIISVVPKDFSVVGCGTDVGRDDADGLDVNVGAAVPKTAVTIDAKGFVAFCVIKLQAGFWHRISRFRS